MCVACGAGAAGVPTAPRCHHWLLVITMVIQHIWQLLAGTHRVSQPLVPLLQHWGSR